MTDTLKSVILGIVEGLTEFIPVSSTGHLILVNRFIDFSGDFANMFNIIIQFGAILAVVVYFWKRLYPFAPHLRAKERQETWDLWFKTIIGVIPALAIGYFADDFIEKKLMNPTTVIIALVIGGIALILLENRKRPHTIGSVAELTIPTVIGIGFIQCLAMIPGTSRSAATIIGAMLLGASRGVAAEFSFFLAIPTIAAASGYSLLKLGFELSTREWTLLGIGFVTSFFVAWAVIAVFMKYITRNDLKPFGYYRIFLGLVLAGYFITTHF